MADTLIYQSEVKDAEIIEIPAKIIYPEVRLALPNGSLEKGDTIEGYLKIKDINGNYKNLGFREIEITLNEYTSDPTMEVLGVVYMSFAESSRIIPSEPVEPATPVEFVGPESDEPIEVIL